MSECGGDPVASGKIELILGPMFSGKTTELIRRTRRHQLAGRRVVVIKYIKDTRYSDARCTTHDKKSCDALCAAALHEYADRMCDYDVVGIDEGQFFPDLVSFSDEMANRGKTVIIAALDGTYQRKPFGHVLELIPLAESVIKLSAVCMGCRKRDAAFSHRISAEKQVEVIGGADKPSRTITEFYTALEPEHKKEAQLRVDELLAGSPRVVSSAPPTPLKHTAAQQARLRP